MQQTDVHILEHLHNGGDLLIDSPADIAANIGFASGSVRHRMPLLRRCGLLEYHDSDAGQYQLTELGAQYVEGQLSDRDIEALEYMLQSG